MQQEDAAELARDFGCLLREVGTRDNLLRDGAREMRATMLHHAIGVGDGADQGDDRVVRNRRVDRDPVKGRQNRAVGPQVADGVERGAMQFR